MRKSLVVCDVCDTLFASNTTFDFIRFILKQENRFRFFVLQCISAKYSPLFYLSIATGKLTGVDLVRSFALSFLKNKKEQQLIDLANHFFDQYLVTRKNEKVFSLLAKQEAKVVLLSSSISPVIAVIASRYGFDYVCSELEFKNSVTTGKLKTDLTEKKHLVVNDLVRDQHIELVAITDNRSDFEMIKMANQRYVVIKKEAEKSFWKELNPQFLNVR